MKLKIWLNRVVEYTGTKSFDIYIDDCVSMENGLINPTPPFSLILNIRNDYKYFITEGNETYEYEDSDITHYVSNTYIIVDGTIRDETFEILGDLISLNLVEVVADADVIMCYKLNNEYNQITKNLTFVKSIVGNFNHSFNIKKIDLDIENFIVDEFNYVYIQSLKRYYYVDSIELMTNDITRLHLSEDVLYSWNDLIYSQKAFVSRYENSDLNAELVDERLPVEDKLTIEYKPLDDEDVGNFELTFDNGCYIVTAFSNVFTLLANYDVESVDGGLSDIQGRKSRQIHYYVLDRTSYEVLLRACANDDVTASFIKSIVWIPFIPDVTLFKIDINTKMFVGNESKHLNSNVDGVANFTTTSDSADIRVGEIAVGVAPYLILKEFTFLPRVEDSFLSNDPYTTYEIYIPLYGWYKVENPIKLFNHRLMIYYSIDLETGISSVFLYDKEVSNLIFSSNCTLGIKMDIITTNALENTRQKQMNDMNMVLSLMGCALGASVGLNAMSVMAVGGSALSSVKSIANTIQKNGMLFERASISFGSADNSLYTPFDTCLRISYRKELVIDDGAYAEINGKPYNNYVDGLGNLTGYVEIPEIHFNPQSEMIYKDEVDEIVSLLKDGVIL